MNCVNPAALKEEVGNALIAGWGAAPALQDDYEGEASWAPAI